LDNLSSATNFLATNKNLFFWNR